MRSYTKKPCINRYANNLNHNDITAIAKLKSYNIKFATADKSKCWVLIKHEDYTNSMRTEHLNDTLTYKLIDNYNNEKSQIEIKRVADKNKHLMTNDIYNFIINPDNSGSSMYGLPKIHKCSEIQTTTSTIKGYIKMKFPLNLKFRPVVAANNTATTNLSKYFDSLLKPLLKYVPAHISDTTDCLNRLPKRVTPDSDLVTLDVTALYTNITQDLGIMAMEHWYHTTKGENFNKLPFDWICTIVKTLDDNAYFTFNNLTYKQLRGVAMGANHSANYAILTMGYIEILVEKLLTPYRETMTSISWMRFIDDIFFIFPNNNLDQFIQQISIINTNIKFTVTTGKSVNFLDLTLKIENEKITTDLYQKPQSQGFYLNYKSAHPMQTLNNIPFTISRRIAVICSNLTTRKSNYGIMMNNLLQCGYPFNIINNSILKFQYITSDYLRQKTPKPYKENLTCVVTYDPNNTSITDNIKNHIRILSQDSIFRDLFHKFPIKYSYKQPRNLKNILEKNIKTNKAVSKCGDPRCGTCQHIIESDIINYGDQKTFNIQTSMTCRSANLLYYLTCATCSAAYIGQTSGTLRKRVTLHRSQINNEQYRKLPVSYHIHTCGSTNNPSFHVIPFYKFKKLDLIVRLETERFYIAEFKPQLNSI